MPEATQRTTGSMIRFGPYELDPQRGVLSRNGMVLKLQPQPLRVLMMLIEQYPETVTREQLGDRVWGSTVHVDLEQNLNYCIRQIRLVLEDRAVDPKFIETLPRQGYRFLAKVVKDGDQSPELAEKTEQSVKEHKERATSVTSVLPIADEEVGSNDGISRRGFVAVIAIGIAAVMAGTARFLGYWRHAPRPRAINVVIPMPAGALSNDPGRLLGPPVVSPNGTTVVVSLRIGAESHLFIRRLDSTQLIRMEGTQGGVFPTWSPDGYHIAFFAEAKLKRTPAGGGAVMVLCDASYPRGSSWGTRGVILFGVNQQALFQVPEGGGEAKAATKLNAMSGENSHRYPVFFPDGNRFLYYSRTDALENRGIYLSSLDGKEIRRRILIADGRFALGQDPDTSAYYLLSQQGGKIVADGIDVRTAKLSGHLYPIVDHGGSMSVSDNGVLVMRTDSQQQWSLVWIDRSGREVGMVGSVGDYWSVALSPDSRFAAIVLHDYLDGIFRIWIATLSNGTMEPFSDSMHATRPVWSRDSRTLYYTDIRQNRLYRRKVSPRGVEELEREATPGIYLSSLSPDGRYGEMEIAKDSSHSAGAYIDVHADPMGKHLQSLDATGGPSLRPAFSPDGRWVCFSSDETGRPEIYIEDFPKRSVRRRISSSGGTGPMWRRDGKELFYLEADESMMSVQIMDNMTMQTGAPRKLFQRRLRVANDQPSYDVSADGQHFIVIEGGDEARNSNVEMVLNWPSLLSE